MGFSDRLDEWTDLEAPDDWQRVLVGNWVLSRIEDPYDGLSRQSGFDNLWFGVVPGSLNADGLAVACSLWISVHSAPFTRTPRPLLVPRSPL